MSYALRSRTHCSATTPCEICLGAGYTVPVPKKAKKTPEDEERAAKIAEMALACRAEKVAWKAAQKAEKEAKKAAQKAAKKAAKKVAMSPSSYYEGSMTDCEEVYHDSVPVLDVPLRDAPAPAVLVPLRSPTASSAAATASAPQSSALEEGDKGYDTDGLCAVAPGESHATLDAPQSSVLSTDPSEIIPRTHYSLPGSSVVSTRDCHLLELRRGDITWVRFKEDRRTWSSFAEWRAAVGDTTNPIVSA